jgi:hypothetical protein
VPRLEAEIPMSPVAFEYVHPWIRPNEFGKVVHKAIVSCLHRRMELCGRRAIVAVRCRWRGPVKVLDEFRVNVGGLATDAPPEIPKLSIRRQACVKLRVLHCVVSTLRALFC